MSDLSSCKSPRGSLPNNVEMRCSCSQQTFILSISFNHIPSIEKSIPFFYTIAKTMFFPASFRDTVRYQGGVPFGFEVTGISDGMGAKISPGLQSKPNNISPTLPLPPPPTHTHTQRETNKQTKRKKKSLFYWKNTHTKNTWLRFHPQKSRNQKTSNTAPSPPKKNPSIIPLIWNPDLPRVTRSILRWFASFIKIKATSVVVLFWHISMIYCF